MKEVIIKEIKNRIDGYKESIPTVHAIGLNELVENWEGVINELESLLQFIDNLEE